MFISSGEESSHMCLVIHNVVWNSFTYVVLSPHIQPWVTIGNNEASSFLPAAFSVRTANVSLAETSVTFRTSAVNMEIDGLDFMNSPPVKTVRFGGSVAETLAKYKQVSVDAMSVCLYLLAVESWELLHQLSSEHWQFRIFVAELTSKTSTFPCLICCFFYCLKGDSSDYELLKHQLADPEIKVQRGISVFGLTRGQ